MSKIKEFFAARPTLWEFAKYSFFSTSAGLLELLVFALLNYFLPRYGVNQPVNWLIFVYPADAGGMGALLAFIVSSVFGQALKFITNFTQTFKSTNNMLLSAVGFAVMAIIVVVGLNFYVGGLLNAQLCKVMDNTDSAGLVAKAIVQVTGFALVYPINKFVLMRKKPASEDTEEA